MVNFTRVTCHIEAPRRIVYEALLDADDVGTWMVPDGMTSRVDTFEPREGGAFRISLTYEEASGAGKTSAHTDTYHGRFIRLIPEREVVEVVEFETADPTLRGEMQITVSLSDSGGGTEVVATHENLPDGLSTKDNELGWQLSLGKLKALAEERAQ